MPKVRDNQTGQVFEVPESDLGKYGLSVLGSPPVQSQIGITKEELTNILFNPNVPEKAKTRAKEIYELNKPKELSGDEQKKIRGRADADRVLTELENSYFGANQGQGLAFGKGGGFTKNLALMTAFGKQIKPELEDLSMYRALRESTRPAFARAMGDVGNLSEPEQEAAIKNVPDEFKTRGEAIKYFTSMRAKLGLPERNIDEVYKPKQTAQRFPQESIVGGQPSQPQNPLMAYLQRGMQGAESVKKPDPNFLADLLFPRGAQTQRKINVGEDVGLDERLGVAGEAAANVLPFAGPGGLVARLALAGVSRGLTEPGTGMGERVKGGAVGGATGLALGKGGQLLGKVFGPLFKSKYGKEVLEEGTKLIEKGSKIRQKVIETAQAKGKQVSGQNIISKMDEWKQKALDANPGSIDQVNRIYDDVVSRFTKPKSSIILPKGFQSTPQFRNLSPKEAFDRWFEIDSGFTSTGITKTPVGASADRALREVFRNELGSGFDQATSLMRKGFEKEELLRPIKTTFQRKDIQQGLKTPVKEFLKKYGPGVGIGAAISTPLSIAAYKILGGRD